MKRKFSFLDRNELDIQYRKHRRKMTSPQERGLRATYVLESTDLYLMMVLLLSTVFI